MNAPGPTPAPGARVWLLHCSDPHTRLLPGATGTVRLVDHLGTVHVAWDNGAQLGLIPGVDAWRYEEEAPTS